MKRLLALACCAFLGSCGNQTTAGGGSDQPNSLNVLVLNNDGRPAVGAALRWVSGSWSPQDTASHSDSLILGWEVKTDSNGRALLEQPARGAWHLEVIDSTARQVAVLDSFRQGTIRLQPSGEWSGYVASKGVVPSHIVLAGTSRTAAIGPDRRFHLTWLPAGQFRLLGRWNLVQRELSTRYLDVGEIVVNDTLDGDSTELPLLDLERRPLRCALRGLFWDDTIAGRWFAAQDPYSKISPSDFPVNPLSALKEEDRKNFLRFSFRLGNSTQGSGPWAGVGMGTAPDARGLDWSGVTGIRILARGRGVVRFQINTSAIDEVRSVLHFGAVISLDNVWRWKEISVKDLWSQNSQGITWAQAADGVHAVAFYALQSDVQLDIADIRVRGEIRPLRDSTWPVGR